MARAMLGGPRKIRHITLRYLLRRAPRGALLGFRGASRAAPPRTVRPANRRVLRFALMDARSFQIACCYVRDFSWRFLPGVSAPSVARKLKIKYDREELVLLSKKKIRNLGQVIQEQDGAITDETLHDLEDYRISFKDFLSYAFKIIDRISNTSFKNAIVTYRIKRFESIINKLSRHPDMCLDRMWDIGGCRCIVKSKEDVYRFKEEISKEFHIRKINDYYKNPQPDGYKSLHIYISKLEDDTQIIEVQVRNYDCHNWATLVEITDFLYGEKIKEKKSTTLLGKMLEFLSRYDSLEWHEKIELLSIIDKYKFFQRLTSVFSRNYIEIRKQWTTIESDIKKCYVLIAAYTEKPPLINTYNSFSEAEKAYFEGFDHNAEENRVLTHIINPKYAKVSIAYSNYVLTYHEFIDEYFCILRDVSFEALEKNNLSRFFKYFIRYRNADIQYINNIRREISTVQGITTTGKSKREEWVHSINDSIQKRLKQRMKYLQLIQNKLPKKIIFKTFFVFIFAIVNTFINWKGKRSKV